MATHGYEWLRMATNGYEWLRMATNGYAWLHMTRTWLHMTTHGYTCADALMHAHEVSYVLEKIYSC